MLLTVVEIFDDLLEDDAADVLEMADSTLSLTEVAYIGESVSRVIRELLVEQGIL